MSDRLIIGIDEVGRGPLAGPVAVGICSIRRVEYEKLKKSGEFWEGKDSKKLTEKRRNESFGKIKLLKAQGVLNYGVFFESNEMIDQHGIIVCLQNAIRRGLKNLNCDPAVSLVMLDGGLKAPRVYANQQTIVRGDELELVISLASIVAKVTRDELMTSLARKYPEYDLASNKGYGCEKHIKTIRELGPSELHRKSFLHRILT